jgi:uncharacterized protein involved in exopolysaccharide biosynthesis
LNAELSRQQVRLRELTSRLGDQHPQVIEANASIAEIRRSLAGASNLASRGLDGTDSVNRQRVAALEASVASQRAKVLKTKELRDRLAALQREVDGAQKALDFVLTRSTQTSLESQNTQTNVTVLKRATPPVKPSSPNTLLNLALASSAGLLLGGVAALLRESFDRRVRSAEDVEADLNATVFGTLLDSSGPPPATGAIPLPTSVRLSHGAASTKMPGLALKT